MVQFLILNTLARLLTNSLIVYTHSLYLSDIKALGSSCSCPWQSREKLVGYVHGSLVGLFVARGRRVVRGEGPAPVIVDVE